MNTAAVPVGGTLFTRPFRLLLAFAAFAFLLIAWRFAVGLGPTTALSDGYPWGLWIAFDVVTGTALACGGYAVGLLVYVLNRNRYHPLIRPAILTSALGYSLAGLSIVIDVGRPWYMYRIPLWFTEWNLNSVLLEVALCIMAYVVVLWLELAPAFLESGRHSARAWLRRLAERATPLAETALPWLLGLGMLLPTMHQSSLGTMMLLTGPKLHPLWSTPLLPLLFLISCLGMGYAAVVFESALSSKAFGRRPETATLASLARLVPWVAFLFLGLRFGDLLVRGRLGQAFSPGLRPAMFWLEAALLLAPALMLLGSRRRADLPHLFRAALLMMVAGGLYRFDTYLVAFQPGAAWSYFPAVPELIISLGLVAVELLIYIAAVKKFPILGGTRPAPALSGGRAS